MNLGGPVWHASVAPTGTRLIPRKELRRMAQDVLRDVGDRRLGEWAEDGERAVHLRRRLSASEQLLVGPVVDVRGTPEAAERIARLGPLLAHVPEHILTEELHGPA